MDLVLWTGVEVHVLVDLRSLGRVESLLLVLDPVLVKPLEEPSLDDGNSLDDRRKNCISEHCFDDLGADKSIPLVRVVVEGAVEFLRQRERLRLEVRIDQQQQETCVEELTDEDTIGNL